MRMRKRDGKIMIEIEPLFDLIITLIMFGLIFLFSWLFCQIYWLYYFKVHTEYGNYTEYNMPGKIEAKYKILAMQRSILPAFIISLIIIGIYWVFNFLYQYYNL